MERYSRLCQTGGPSGGTRELVKSGELETFLRQLGILNFQAGCDAVEQTLSGFRRLSQSDDLPPEQRPMLIRYSPIELAGQPGWAQDVMPFLALCATGTDGRGQQRHHTYFFRPGLLRRAGVYHYLDHLFGSHFAVTSGEDADPDLPPLRVEPAVRPEDAPLVKLAAAAILKKRCILLKLEKDCDFNRRAMELLAQIYALLPPELAIQTGFSSYQDPNQLEKLMRTTPIRIFLTHADCDCSASDPGYLYFDLNQPLNLQLATQQAKDFQVGKALLTYLTYWHSMPWWERQPLMELLFADEKHLPNEQSYCSITGSFVREPFIQWINRNPDRGTITSLEELKEKYDSFPICDRIPVLRKKFRMAVPALLKPPATLEALAKDAARRLSKAPEEEQEQLKTLSAFAQMLLSIRLEEPKPASKPRTPDREDRSEELRELREKLAELTEENQSLQKNHAEQLQKVESELQEYIDLLSRENETLKSSLSGQTDAQEELTRLRQAQTKLEQDLSWQLHETEQAYQAKLTQLTEENHSLRQAQTKLEQDLSWQLHETEQAYQEKLTQLRSAHEAALKQAAEGMVPGRELAAAKEEIRQLKLAENLLLTTALEQQAAALEEQKLAHEAALKQLNQAHADELQKLQLERIELLEKTEQELKRHRQAQASMFDQLLVVRKERDAAQNALAAQNAELEQRHAEELALLLKNHDDELQKRNADHQAVLEQQLQVLHDRHNDEIGQLLASHDKQLESLVQKHADDLNRIRQEHHEYTKQLRTEAESAEAKVLMLTNKLAQMTRERDDARTQAEQALRAEFSETLSAEREALGKQHADELARHQAAAAETEESLRREIRNFAGNRDALTAQLNEAHAADLEKLEQEHAADLNRIRQEHNEYTKQLRTEAESAEAKVLMLTNKLAQLTRERDDARTQAEQALRAEFTETLSAELQAQEQRHAEALAQQKAEAEEAHLRKLRTLEAQHAETLAQQQAGAQEAEKALTALLESRHAQELTQLEARYQTKQKQLREELDQTARDLNAANQKHQQFKADMKQQFNKKCEEILAAAQERIQQLEQELAAAKSVTVADPNAGERLREALEAERARYTQLETKMESTVRETEAAFLRDREQLTQDHEKVCAELRSQVQTLEQKLRTAPTADQAAAEKFRSDIEKINENNVNARQALEQKFRSDIEQINANNTKARQALELKHKSEIEQINATNAKLRQELQEQHAAEKKQLQEQVMKTVSEQWEKLNEANRTIRDLQQQLENASQPQSEDPSSGTRTPWWKR